MRKRLWLYALLLALVLLLGGCAQRTSAMKDGYYTAEVAEYDEHGWKEYVTILVKDGRIITAEYNASNISGFIKSWDISYMRDMNAVDGTYPNEYTRAYAADLLEAQSPDGVDMISGATHSYATMTQLSAAAIERAQAGDHSVAQVTVDEWWRELEGENE